MLIEWYIRKKCRNWTSKNASQLVIQSNPWADI